MLTRCKNAVRAPLPCQWYGWTRQKPWRRTDCQGCQQFLWWCRWSWVKGVQGWQQTASGHHLLTTTPLHCSIHRWTACSPSLLRSSYLSHLPQQLGVHVGPHVDWTTGSSSQQPWTGKRTNLSVSPSVAVWVELHNWTLDIVTKELSACQQSIKHISTSITCTLQVSRGPQTLGYWHAVYLSRHAISARHDRRVRSLTANSWISCRSSLHCYLLRCHHRCSSWRWPITSDVSLDAVSTACLRQLRSITRILTSDSDIALVTQRSAQWLNSRIDYCNAVLAGVHGVRLRELDSPSQLCSASDRP